MIVKETYENIQFTYSTVLVLKGKLHGFLFFDKRPGDKNPYVFNPPLDALGFGNFIKSKLKKAKPDLPTPNLSSWEKCWKLRFYREKGMVCLAVGATYRPVKKTLN